MTNIRSTQPPALLDISRFDLGPPLTEARSDTFPAGSPPKRDLVALRARDVVDIAARDAAPEVAPQAPRQLPPPDHTETGPDVRHMTPREMLNYSESLYVSGHISFEDYEALAFQPDLHPDFNRTIGALTGEKAAPDRPRDFIRHWQDRLNFTQRYYPSNANEVRQAHRILEVIRVFPRTDIYS